MQNKKDVNEFFFNMGKLMGHMNKPGIKDAIKKSMDTEIDDAVVEEFFEAAWHLSNALISRGLG